MQEKMKSSFNVHMIVGMAGLLLLMAGVFQLLIVTFDPISYALSGIGLAFVIHYIYKLETKAGMSSRFQWIRSIVLILITILLILFLMLKPA